MGLSTCAKGAIACGVCTAVILAIMIPVGILVIAPALGQHALTKAAMQIPNSTIYNLEDLMADPDGGRIFNKVELTQNFFPFNTKLLATDLVMHMPCCYEDYNGDNFSAVDLAWFQMPEQIINHGVTTFEFDQGLNVLNPSNFTFMAFGLTLSNLFPPPMGPRLSKVEIWMVGRPKLVALGFVQIGPLKLGKKLQCTYDPITTTTTTGPTTTGSITTSNPTSDSTERLTGRRLQGLSAELACTQSGDMNITEIDSVMDKFDSDGGFRHLTSTTTTTTAADSTTTAASLV
jgi:hypothetical protein